MLSLNFERVRAHFRTEVCGGLLTLPGVMVSGLTQDSLLGLEGLSGEIVTVTLSLLIF